LLGFLRTGHLHIEKGLAEEKVYSEAEFYSIEARRGSFLDKINFPSSLQSVPPSIEPRS
jgi:hypothetical protein